MGELDGRVMLVTGATTGVGKEIARGLLKKGATVIAVARDPAKAADVVAAGAQFISADLSSMKGVRALGAAIVAAHPKLHAVVHNAAMVPRVRRVSDEGMELAFAANVAAPYVLTHSLLPSLVAGAPSRVVMLIGAATAVDFDDLQLEKGDYSGWTAYQRSKFASLLVLKHLSSTLPREVSVHGAFPGIVNTPGMDDVIAATTNFGRIMLTLMKPFMRTPERGAFAPIWVASAPELSSSTGRLWTWKEPLERGIPKGWDDPESIGRMARELERLTALPVPAPTAN